MDEIMNARNQYLVQFFLILLYRLVMMVFESYQT